MKCEAAEMILNQRLKLGVAQSFVANRLGVTTVFISWIEHGQRKIPKRFIRRICFALQLPEQDLIDAMKRDMMQEFEDDIKDR
jgi:transcriptional regulator with XRE-family HTH domain